MRIGIDATAWGNPRGYGRYLRGLVNALNQTQPIHEYVLFIDRFTFENRRDDLPRGAEYVLIETSRAPALAASAGSRRSLRDILAVSRSISRSKLDVLFFPSVFTYVPCRTRAKILLGIHDVIAEDHPRVVFPGIVDRSMWTLKVWLGRWQCDLIVTVSEYARDGIVRRFNWPPEKIRIVAEAPDPIFAPVEDSAQTVRVLDGAGLSGVQRYLICLGGLNPHKNLLRLLNVFAELRREPEFGDVHLVLAGPAESDTFTPGAEALRKAIRDINLEAAVHITGFLPDEQLVHLLSAARALVMPSLAEGFGLGAVEAAACGTPVLATRNSPLPDLLAGGGIFFDPLDPAEMGAAIRRILVDEEARLGFAREARERAARLTWANAAAQFVELVADLDRSSA